MSETKTIAPSTADTFDTDKIAIVSARAQLKVGGGVPTYASDNPTITISETFSIEQLTNFVEVATKPSLTEIKYILNSKGQDKHFTSGSWQDSDGTYAQANTASEIKSNVKSLLVQGSLVLKIFLHSDDGTATPII